MDKDFLKDRFMGCLLGMAIGDALGAAVEGLTPIQVMSRFHTPIDGFFASKTKGLKPGDYTEHSKTAFQVTIAIQKNSGWNSEAIKTLLPTLGITSLFSRVVPIALLAAGQNLETKQMVEYTEQLVENCELQKSDFLALLIFEDLIKEIIRNPKQCEKPYDLYDSDESLLGRIIKKCWNTEAKIEDEENPDRLGDHLDIVRRKLMQNSPLHAFYGINGARNDTHSVLALAIFAYMRVPDDFITICKTVSLGGNSSLNGAVVGALIGATMGASLMPLEMKDNVKNGVRIQSLASDLADTCPLEEIKPNADVAKAS